jgi:N-acetylmuramoyl-L-alanine amidase
MTETRRRIIVIDPGHGGTAAVGGSSPNNATGPAGTLEKNVTLDLAQRVGRLLQGDFDVFFTRTADVNLSLADRAAVARTHDADVFVSIHLNGFHDASVDGTETWVAPRATAASRRFAADLLRRLVAVTGVRDRGVREENFGVIQTDRHTAHTAVTLAEIAFLTNTAQEQRLLQAAYCDELAAAIAAGVRAELQAQSTATAHSLAISGLDGNDEEAPGGESPRPADDGLMGLFAPMEAAALAQWTVAMDNPVMTVTDAAARIRGGPPSFTPDGTRNIPRYTQVRQMETSGAYSRVCALDGAELGWTATSNLRAYYKDDPALAAATLAPAAAIAVDAAWQASRRGAAAVYNRLGGLMQAIATRLNVPVASVIGVWLVESGGHTHTVDSAIIRFENHLLWDRWGSSHAATYDQHFRHGTRAPQTGTTCNARWKCHQYRRDANGTFASPHASQTSEYDALDVAAQATLAGRDAAVQCISIGGPQILVSNFRRIGYDTPVQMYDAFQAGERAHVLGFFDFAQGPPINALRARNWSDFARHYNGSGKAAEYGTKIGDAVAAAEAVVPVAAPAAANAFVNAFGEPQVSVQLVYDVALVAQPDKLSCWAASMAMLVGYYRGQSIPAESLARDVGRSLRTSYGWDLLEAVKRHYGLTAISLPSNLSLAPRPAEWHQWLRDYGPLWVTTTGRPSHAIIVRGIEGDLTEGGTTLHILNPWDTTERFSADPIDFSPANHGRAYTRPFRDFAGDFGNLGLANYGEWRVLYAGVRAARTQGLADEAQLTQEELVDAERSNEGAFAQSLPPMHALEALAEPLSRPRMRQADVRWAADDVSPDYRHLGESGVSQSFAFTAAHLARLCELNDFDVTAGRDEVLFGLRGCSLIGGTSAAFASSVTLTENLPNHHENHCVVGVWKRSTRQLAVFQASTIPNWKLMESARQGGTHANLLPTGRYLYHVGPHRPGSSHPIPGAFRQVGRVVVLRTDDDLTYTVTDRWEAAAVGDNIHAGRNDANRTGPFFSSAGCQTVPGNYTGGQHLRLWSDFRIAAGLSANTPASENGRAYLYVLFTGRDARLAVTRTNTDGMRRLRFGSSGVNVRALQEALHREGLYRGTIDENLGADCMMAYIEWQKRRSQGAAAAVVTPADALALGVDILHRSSVAPPSRGAGVALAVVGSGRARINVPLLNAHATGDNAVLRWNLSPATRAATDVVVHLHGFVGHGSPLDLDRKDAMSGIDLDTRTRPTVGIMPLGKRTGATTGNGTVDVVDFPALVHSAPRLTELLRTSLDWMAAQQLQQQAGSLNASRLILTAHSGGGARLERLVALRHDPAEVHLFDALYGTATAVEAWAATHIAQDGAMLAAAPHDEWEARMVSSGGALRAIYIPTNGTRPGNTHLQAAIDAALSRITDAGIRDTLRRYYRVERAVNTIHNDVPRTYGPQLLADASINLAHPAPAHARAHGIAEGVARMA